MLRTLNTLLRGLASEAEEAVIDRNALILLDQKIRDTQSGLTAAKLSLAGLVKRDRLEERQLETIAGRTADLEPRIAAALTSPCTRQGRSRSRNNCWISAPDSPGWALK